MEELVWLSLSFDCIESIFVFLRGALLIINKLVVNFPQVLLFNQEVKPMDWTEVYGHNIYIDDRLVGYISGNQADGNAILFISGHEFAGLSSEGVIAMDGLKVGYIDDSGDVYLRKKLVGEVDPKNDIRFYGTKLAV